MNAASHVAEWQISDVIAFHFLFLTTYLRTAPHILRKTRLRSIHENEALFPFDLGVEENIG